MEAHQGDRIMVDSNKVGASSRAGQVIEVITGPGGPHYRVRWDDGRETTFFPSNDTHVVSPAHESRR